MGRAEAKLSCARSRVLLEPYLDGALEAEPRIRVEWHLATCADCRAEYEAAQQLQQALRALPTLEYPTARLEAVFDQVARETAGEVTTPSGTVLERLRRWLLGSGWPGITTRPWRVAVATLAVAAVALTVTLVLRQPSQPGPSQVELAQAEREALLALAYVIHVTQGTSHAVLADAVGDVVREVAPVGGVMGNVGVVVAGMAAKQVVGPMTHSARATGTSRLWLQEEVAPADTMQEEERQ